jgi:hypothetical protein
MKTQKAQFTADMMPLIAVLIEQIGGDGHTLWKPTILEDFPMAIQKRFVQTITSHPTDYKQQMFDNDGNLIPQMDAVHGMRLLMGIADDLGLPYESKFGRGFQAQECTDAIVKWIKELSDNGLLCVLCGSPYAKGRGANPAPISSIGSCCKDCDDTRVIPARLVGLGVS